VSGLAVHVQAVFRVDCAQNVFVGTRELFSNADFAKWSADLDGSKLDEEKSGADLQTSNWIRPGRPKMRTGRRKIRTDPKKIRTDRKQIS
jgi:hypothetical protein